MDWTQALIVILSLIGAATAYYTYTKRQEREENRKQGTKDHDAITHIKNLLFLETPLELIIMGYFALLALVYIVKLIVGVSIAGLDLATIYLSGIMFFLIFYKMVMEGGVVKNFSPWALLVLILSGAVLSFILLDFGTASLITLLTDAFNYSLTLHFLGMVLGLGATTVVDIMFLHFLRNFKISAGESVIMHLLSQMIILGLSLLIISGIGLFLTDIEGYLDSPTFLMKMTAVLVAFFNGWALNLYTTPKMKKISLKEEEVGKYETLKRVSFALGAISIISWYAAFFLAMLDVLGEFSYTTLLVAYLILLAIGIGGSQVAKKYYEMKAPAQ